MRKNKNRKVAFYSTQPLDEMLARMKEYRGDEFESATIKESIRVAHAKMFPVYADKKTQAIEGEGAEPIAKEKIIQKQVRNEDARKEARAKMKLDKQINICDMLGGTVNDAKTHCQYFKYDGKDRYPQEIPLNLLDEGMVDTQYTPSKERVLELQKNKKTNYV